MAFNTSRTFTSRGRPPRLAGGIAGSTSAHSASVKSLGYRKPRRSAARRCSGVHIEHPLESIRVLDNESHPIPPTQQLLGSALRRGQGMTSAVLDEFADILFPSSGAISSTVGT